MNRIKEKVSSAQSQKRKLLIPFLTAGYPDAGDTVPLLLSLERAGADVIELGIPFSDPIADGPTIQRSSFEALQKGLKLSDIFSMVRELRKKSSVPILFFTYYNPVFHYGLEEFFKEARDCGADGLLVPDLPPDEAEDVIRYAKIYDISLVFLVAPTTTPERIDVVEKYSTDFVYTVSIAGTTGARDGLSEKVEPFLSKINTILNKPHVVGFGISTPVDVRKISQWCDGVVVGSALINFIRNNAETNQLYDKVETFMKSLREALDS